jgi:ATP-dependent Clp protease ATP-binding subunit ClpA
MFKHLSLVEITKIVEKFLAEVNYKLSEKGMSIKWDEKTLEELARLGYSPLWGARELRRVVQEKIEDILANEIINGTINDGNEVYLSGLKIIEVK